VQELLAAAKLHFRNLRGLNAAVLAAGLRHLLTANAALTTLDLRDNLIDNIVAVGLGEGLSTNSALTTLYLEKNLIGDAGAVGLGEGIAANAALTRLNLGNNRIGDAGRAAIRAAQPTLQLWA